MALKHISPANAEQLELCARAARDLQAYLAARPAGATQLRLGSVDEETKVLVPATVMMMLVAMLEDLAHGHGVAVAPLEKELTTQDAADLLNVSRPYLIGLLEAGELSFRRVGNRRKIRLVDVLGFRERDLSRRAELADQLTAEAQDLGLYD